MARTAHFDTERVLREVLNEITIVINPSGPPTIISWSTGRLAAEVAKRLGNRGLVLTTEGGSE